MNKFFGPVLAIVLLISCTDVPNPVGGSLLPATDVPVIKVDTIYASSHSVSPSPLNSLSSPRFMVGKYQSYEAAGLLQFAMPESLRGVSVTDAKITLRANYHFGDSLAPLSFSTYRATQRWTGESLTLDSLNQGGYYDPTPIASPVSVVIGDSDFVQFSITDTALVRAWLAADSTKINYGIVFRATNSNVIKGFASFSSLNTDTSLPRLTVQYVKNGNPGTIDIKTGSAKFLANIDRASLIQDPDLIYVQAGVAYVGYLSFITTAPVPAKASIHNARLELTLKSDASRFNTYTIDSLVVNIVDQLGTNFDVFAVSDDTTISGQKVYRFPIQPFVQRWVRGAPASLSIYTFAEIQVLDLFVLYGETAPAALRPRVIVTYSKTR